jgi:hypothetical protein
MKVRNILRTQAIVIGFGAALLLANSAPAQEIVNSTFNDGPNVASFDQPVAKSVTLGTSDETTAVQGNSGAVEASVATPIVSNEAVTAMENSAERWLIAASLCGLLMLAVYAVAEVRRANRNEMERSPLHPHATVS